jgi:Putative addiction module component
MTSAIQLDQMTVQDKLRVLEEIWEDLLRTAHDFPAPKWHVDVLSGREIRVREGKSKYTPWDKAKNNIREQTR